jgi:regulator of nonsense transcripts 2
MADQVKISCTLFQYREILEVIVKRSLNGFVVYSIANFLDDSFFHKLDSSLKKNTAFVRKMKSFSEVQKDAIMKEMNSLNLTKYIGEVAAAIVEAKLKMNDLPAIIEICSL